MMKQAFFSILTLASLAFVGCNSPKQVSADESSQIAGITGKRWQLIELDGKPINGKINGRIPYLEFHEKDSRYAATGGCNTMNGQYEFATGNKIKFTGGISTMMACEDMESDKALAEVFKLSNNYTVHDGILALNVGRRSPLARFKEVASSEGLAGNWELDYIAGSDKPFNELFPDKKPTITFENNSTKVAGNGGCNNYFSTAEITGHKIKFAAIGSTRMACPGAGEPLFFQTLEKVNVYSVSENTLTMIIGDIAVMRFQKK